MGGFRVGGCCGRLPCCVAVQESLDEALGGGFRTAAPREALRTYGTAGVAGVQTYGSAVGRAVRHACPGRVTASGTEAKLVMYPTRTIRLSVPSDRCHKVHFSAKIIRSLSGPLPRPGIQWRSVDRHGGVPTWRTAPGLTRHPRLSASGHGPLRHHRALPAALRGRRPRLRHQPPARRRRVRGPGRSAPGSPAGGALPGPAPPSARGPHDRRFPGDGACGERGTDRGTRVLHRASTTASAPIAGTSGQRSRTRSPMCCCTGSAWSSPAPAPTRS